MENPKLETERLFFRIIQPSDKTFLYQLMNTAGWIKFVGDKGMYSQQKAEKYIIDNMSENVWSKGFENFVMVDKEHKECIGTCSLHNREGIDGLDIGCALLPHFEKNGFATEGVHRMVVRAFKHYNQIKVSAITNPANNGSIKLLNNCGFLFKGEVKLPHDDESLNLYVLNRKL